MIVVDVVLTADNPDVLSGSDLANIPIAGALMIFACSTQNDTQVTITGPGNEPVARGVPMTLRANAEIRFSEDVNYQMVATQGGRYVIDVDVVTAATVRVRVIFMDAEDLGLV